MSRFGLIYSPLSSICYDEIHCTDWQLDSVGFANARTMTNEGINGARRPFQIVIATDRQLPLGDIVDSIILSTEGTGLLQGRFNGTPLVSFHLMLRGENSIRILEQNDKHIERLENAGVNFTYEECYSSAGVSQLTSARECALQFIRNLSKETSPIILWLDDDLAFDSLIPVNGKIKLCRPWSFFHEIWRYHEIFPNVSIGLGDVTGAPPLPASSTLHTNMVDLVANLRCSPTRNVRSRWGERDYYYDLSENRLDYSPWPFPVDDINTRDVLWNLLEVGTLARPLVSSNYSAEIQQGRYVRGGNTIIFDYKFVDDIDHPKIPRRGDSIWALKVRNRGGILGHFPIPLRHIRDIKPKDWTPENSLSNWLRRLEVDLVGASFQRWYASSDSEITPEAILVQRCKSQLECFESAAELLEYIPEDIRVVLQIFIDNGIERVNDLISNPSVFADYNRCVEPKMAAQIASSSSKKGVIENE